MSTVELCDVRKSYGKVEIIRGISASIKEGEFVALVGPSGCGKSTLLRMIAGLEPISSGEIRFGGRVVNHESPKDRNIAMVFQNYALYPHMTVRNNIGFALKQRNYSTQEINKRVQEAAQMLGLESLLDRKPKELSGGQRQRVAMGRAIVRDPAVFLFDEPLSNLDAKLRGQMRTEIKALHQRLGTTTVYVTHDQIEAMTLADRVIVMNAGQVEQEGHPLALYDHPKTAFVAAFIGSPPMNFFQGNVVANNVLQLDEGLQLPLPVLNLNGKSRVIIGVRPEHFVISERGWPATVSIIESMGAETQITVQIGRQLVRVVQAGRTNVCPGDSISLSVSPDYIHVFDSESMPVLSD